VWSPKKGGGLREQRTGGRRLLVGSLLGAGLVVAPLLLLGAGVAPRAAGGAGAAAAMGARAQPGLLGGLSLAFQAPGDTTTATSPPATTTTEVDPTTTTAPPPPPRPAVTQASADGLATWYAAAPAGRCASPWLPFGTVLTVTDLSTGASITCVVDDREAAGYPHVVDLSPSGFASLAPLGQGTIEVDISW